MTRLRGGQAVLSVMFLSLILLMAFFVSCGTWLFQANLQGRVAGAQGAQRLAETSVQLAIARLIHEPGLSPADLPSVNLELPGYAGGHALLAFEPGQADGFQIPVSVNNLTGSASLPGWENTVVEAQTANLVGVGRYRGVEERVEVVLNIPKFPYVVASSVPLAALDGLSVFGLSPLASLNGGLAGLSDDDKVAGHLVTNAPNPSPDTLALRLLGAATHIRGDAQSRGGILLSGGATVDGKIRPQSDSVPLPKIDITPYDPGSQPACTHLTRDALAATELSGFNRREGDLAVDGGLKMNGGVLYVKGNLHVTGGLSGSGAILATGGVTVEGGGSLTGENQAAILANGPVTLHGTSTQSAEYHGLIYTEGDLDCRYADIAGAVVVNNPDQANGHAILEHVTLAEAPTMTSLDLRIIQDYTTSTAGGTTGTPGSSVTSVSPVTVNTTGPNGVGLLSYINASGTGLYTGSGVGPNLATLSSSGGGYAVPAKMPDDVLTLGSGTLIYTPPGGGSKDTVVVKYETTDQLRDNLTAALQAMNTPEEDIPGYVDAAVDSAVKGVTPEKVQEWVNALNGQQASDQANGTHTVTNNPDITSTTSGGATRNIKVSHWALDLSQFFKLAERIRILSWRRV